MTENNGDSKNRFAWDLGDEPKTGGGSDNANHHRPDSEPIDPRILLELLMEPMSRSMPEDLRQQLRELQRELLMAMRALIDWYLERLDETQPAEHEVEEIQID